LYVPFVYVLYKDHPRPLSEFLAFLKNEDISYVVLQNVDPKFYEMTQTKRLSQWFEKLRQNYLKELYASDNSVLYRFKPLKAKLTGLLPCKPPFKAELREAVENR
jgi:hypothetical protein